MKDKCLLNRLEYKYLFPTEQLDDIKKRLMPFVRGDSFAAERPEKQYTVRSIYLDTIDLQNYFEKEHGIKFRKKFRIRGYNSEEHNSKVFLEIKRKTYNYISKNRSSLNYRDLFSFFDSRNIEKYIIPQENGKHIDDTNKFLYYMFAKSLRPLVLVVYDREPFFSKFDPKFRLSFDKNLRSALFPSYDDLYDENILKEAIPGYYVLEVKFFGVYPNWMKEIINEFNLTRRSVSKYMICLDDHNIKEHLTYVKTLSHANFSHRKAG